MTILEARKRTYVPGDSKAFENFLKRLDSERDSILSDDSPKYILAGSNPSDRIEIPAQAYKVLLQVIEAMGKGLAVTVAPQSKVLTTQQAAELLGVSRPTLIRLLDSEQIPFERVGTHRKVLLKDILDFRELRRASQYRALADSAIDIEDDDDVEFVLDTLRTARKRIATAHRA